MAGTVAPQPATPPLAMVAAVCGAVASGFLAIGIAVPVLPRYIHGPLGAGDAAVGVVMGAFALSAVVSRFVAGRLADARGRRLVILVGLLLIAASGAIYIVPAGVPGLVLARIVLGTGEGWIITAGATWIFDLAPADRRGQAIGLLAAAPWVGLGLGPVIGEVVLAAASYTAAFAVAAAVPLAGVALVASLPECRRADGRHAASPPRTSLLPPGTWLPGVALGLSNVAYATMMAFLVLHLEARGISHAGLIFAVLALSVVVGRLAAGRLPDRVGPERMAVGALAIEAAGVAVIALAHDPVVGLVGAVTTGLGMSFLFPSVALVVVDRVAPDRRGAGIGALTAFGDVGLGIGAPIAGLIAAGADYPTALWTVAACVAGGGAVVATRLRPQRRRGLAEPGEESAVQPAA